MDDGACTLGVLDRPDGAPRQAGELAKAGKGGGEVAVQLVGNHVDSTVNNPIEAVAQWRAGKLRPLCVFDSKRMPYTAKVTADMAWSDIPTCKESGLPVDRHVRSQKVHAHNVGLRSLVQ